MRCISGHEWPSCYSLVYSPGSAVSVRVSFGLFASKRRMFGLSVPKWKAKRWYEPCARIASCSVEPPLHRDPSVEVPRVATRTGRTALPMQPLRARAVTLYDFTHSGNNSILRRIAPRWTRWTPKALNGCPAAPTANGGRQPPRGFWEKAVLVLFPRSNTSTSGLACSNKYWRPQFHHEWEGALPAVLVILGIIQQVKLRRWPWPALGSAPISKSFAVPAEQPPGFSLLKFRGV